MMACLHLDAVHTAILVKGDGVLPSLIDERCRQIAHTIRMLNVAMHIAHHYLVTHIRREVHSAAIGSQGQGDTDPRRHVAFGILPGIAYTDTTQSSRVKVLCHESHLGTGFTNDDIRQCWWERTRGSPGIVGCCNSLRRRFRLRY